MTELYAIYTAETPEQARRQHDRVIERERASWRNRQRLQHEYTLLPWTMEELPGTTWRNVYTASIHTVERLAENRWGKIGPDPDKWINSMFEIGLWVDEQYCISHWVRVDHLPGQVQVDWARERIACCRQALAQEYENLEKVKKGESGGSVSYRKKTIAWHEGYLAQARRELKDIAARFQIPLTVNILNVGIQAGEQMILI